MNIIFDYNRTLFDPETQSLYPGVPVLLKSLSLLHTLFLVSRKEPIRMQTIDQLGIAHLFTQVLFVEQKTPELFATLVSNPEGTLVVGDCLRSEIEAGNLFGATTVHIKQGMFRNELPAYPMQVPTYTLDSLDELPALIQQL